MNDTVNTVADSAGSVSDKIADKVSKVSVPDVQVHKATAEASIGDTTINLDYDRTAEQQLQVSISN